MKTEAFANKVAKQYFGQDDLSKIDPIALLAFVKAIMDMVMEMMNNCPNQPNKVATTIKNPNLFNRVRFGRLVRERLKGQEDSFAYTQVIDACEKVAETTDITEIEEVVKEVKKPNYWLI
jgi:hypothetical protein